jgi:glycosyltransferase involved in cell wall biosynthesis
MTTLHPPDDVRILLKECRTLADSGYDVVLAARVPSPTTLEGVPVVPIGTCDVRTGLVNLARRLMAAWRAARRVRADAYHLHDPELIPVGLLLRKSGATVTYDVHEDTPLDLRTIGDGSLGARALSRFWRITEGLAGRRFDAVVAATPKIGSAFPAEKTIVLRNYPLLAELAALEGHPQRERDRSIVYIGRISEDRGILKMLEAVERADVRLRLVGPMAERLRAQLRQHPGWEAVDYRGRVPHDEVLDELRRARAGMLVLEPRQAYLESLPVKLFEYMAAGIPLIASDFPAWREIVAGANCGLLVDPADTDAIVEAIEWVVVNPEEADALGARGRIAIRDRYNWDRESGELVSLYSRLSASLD